MRRVAKPWGYELRFVRTERYAGKLLFIKAGSQLSLQYHEQKDEAFLVQAGSLELVLGRGAEQRVERLAPGEDADALARDTLEAALTGLRAGIPHTFHPSSSTCN